MTTSEAIQIRQIGATDDPRLFTLSEAQELLPLVRKITEESVAELTPIKQRLSAMLSTDPRTPNMEREYEGVIKRWVSKMERLGLVVKGLWLVDFDTGDGYLCWKYPELRIAYYHNHDEGYADRRPLKDVIEEYDPDWV